MRGTSSRRTAREWVVQMLFELDLNPKPLEDLFEEFWKDRDADPETESFACRTVSGIMMNRDKIDGIILENTDNWAPKRMGVVDRNVIRMAVYEMLFCFDIPPVVSINEAVDIAKYFSAKESGRFVNGVLDKIRKGLNRPARKAGKVGDGA